MFGRPPPGRGPTPGGAPVDHGRGTFGGGGQAEGPVLHAARAGGEPLSRAPERWPGGDAAEAAAGPVAPRDYAAPGHGRAHYADDPVGPGGDRPAEVRFTTTEREGIRV